MDSIVTAINVDMIGRGRAEDVIGGGDNYTGILGARRLSADLGNIVDEVNARRTTPIKLDSRFDDPTIGTSHHRKPVPMQASRPARSRSAGRVA